VCVCAWPRGCAMASHQLIASSHIDLADTQTYRQTDRQRDWCAADYARRSTAAANRFAPGLESAAAEFRYSQL